MKPCIGLVYTLHQILKDLVLLDSPSLLFDLAGPNDEQMVLSQHVVQDSHVLPDDLLTIPGFADTKWQYERTTSEWIPLFHYVDTAPITDFVDMEPEIDFDLTEKNVWWATPKGYPREQYYKKLRDHSEKVSLRMEVKINGATICIIDKEIAGQVQAVNWQQMCDDYIKQLSFEKMQELAVSEAASRRDVV